MSLSTYADLTGSGGLSAWLDHTIFSANYSTMVQLFEAVANRRLRVRQQEVTTLLIPSNPALISVTGATSGVGGVVQLAVTSTSTFVTGQEVIVLGVGGTTEANGSWFITIVDPTHLSLNGSTFANAYVSGGTVNAMQGQVALPSDYLAWRRVTWTGQTRRELQYVHPSYFQASYPTQPIDIPAFFTIEGNKLEIMPIDGTPLEFDYYQLIPSLQTSTTNWLMTSHPDIYLFGTLVEAELFGVNDDRALTWKARRDELFEEITMRDRQTRGPSYVRVFGPTP
jgi:hypothetical protein